MLSIVEREFLNSNPYFLIKNNFYKFQEIVNVEGDEQLIIVRNMDNGQVLKITLYDFRNSTQDLQITAQGKCYEMLLEIKRAIEINALK